MTTEYGAISFNDIYTEQGINEQILAYPNWGGLYTVPTSFALWSKLGNIETSMNPKLLIPRQTGVKRIYTATADFTTAAAGSVVAINFETAFGTGSHSQFRKGNMVHINGYDATTYASKSYALVELVSDVGDGANWNCKTIASYAGSTASSAISWDAVGAKGNTYASLTDNQLWNSSAPEALSITPEFREQWCSLKRFSYTVDNVLAGTDTYFTNKWENTSNEAESMLLGAFNHDLLFSTTPVKDNSADSVTLVGTGKNSSLFGGLPWMLQTTDLSASSCVTRYGSAARPTTLSNPSEAESRAIMSALYTISDQFDGLNGALLALTSTNMRALIRDVANTLGVDNYAGEIALPNITVYYQEIDLGGVKIRMVVDEALNNENGPYIYDGTNLVFANYFMYILDPRYMGFSYRVRDKFGIMVPSNLDIEAINNELSERKEWRAEGMPALWNQRRHAVFFLYGSDS